MDTRERLVRYQGLIGDEPSSTARFLKENRQDERFVSLARIGTTFIDGFRTHFDRLIEFGWRPD